MSEKFLYFGAKQLVKAHQQRLTVEIESIKLPDGKPLAFKIEQLRVIDYMALGNSIPVPSSNAKDEDKEITQEEQRDLRDWMVRLVLTAVKEYRVVFREQDGDDWGDWQSDWVKINMREGEGADLWREIDNDNVLQALYKPLMNDLNYGGEFAELVVDRPFREGGSRANSNNGQVVREVSA